MRQNMAKAHMQYYLYLSRKKKYIMLKTTCPKSSQSPFENAATCRSPNKYMPLVFFSYFRFLVHLLYY